MPENIEKSILEILANTGWASAKRIAESIKSTLEETKSALEKLVSENKVQMRKRGRGHQFGPIESVKKEKEKPEKPRETAPPKETVFSSIDEFLVKGILSIPKNKALSAREFGETLIKNYPNSSWTEYDVIQGLGKLIRLGKVGIERNDKGDSTKFNYFPKI